MSVLQFLKDYLRISTLLSIPLILAILLIIHFQGGQETSPQKLTVAEFQEKRQEFKEKYPAIPVWDNRNVVETVKMLNHAIEQHADGEDKSRDEVLADMNMLLEKWGDPEKAAALRREVERIKRLPKELPKDKQKSE